MTEGCLLLLLAAGILTLFWEEAIEIACALHAALTAWYESLQRMEVIEEESGLTGKGKEDLLSYHLKTLLQLTLGIGSERGLKAFLVLCGVCGGLVILLLGHRISLNLTLEAMLLAMLLPYAGLRLILRRKRAAASREGEILLTELLENYKICYLNMRRAIEVSARTMKEAPHAKRLLFSLSKGLNRGSTDVETARLLEEFRLSLQTSWGNILAANLWFALTTGTEITAALQDLADTMLQARKIDEYAGRENHEAAMILRYLAPLCYALTVIGAIFYFRLTPRQFFYYQFQTQTGLSWFVISLMLYVGGLLVYGFISRGRLDL